MVIIGAINWLLIGVFQFDLVAAIFGGQDAAFSRIIYSGSGLAGLYCISFLFRTHTDVEQGTRAPLRNGEAPAYPRSFFFGACRPGVIA